MMALLSSAVKGYSANYVGLPKACWQGISLTFINATSVGICFFLSLYFVNTLHFNVASAGVLISCYGLGTVTGGIVGGKLSDKISPKIVSMFSLLLQAIAFLFLTKLNSIEFLMANLFILGAAAYGFKTSNNVRILDQCREKSDIRLKTVNIAYAASNLGLGLAGVIIGLCAEYGFSNIFYMSSLLLFSSLVYLFLQKLDQAGNLINHNNNICDVKEKRLLAIDSRIVALILICIFVIGLIIAQLSATYPLYVQGAFPQLGMKAASILFVLDTVLIVLFQAPLVNVLTGLNKIFIVGVGALLMGLGMLVLSFSSYFFLAIISCVIWTTGEMLFMPMAQLICYEKGAERRKGQALGVFQSTFAMSTIMGPTLGSFIYQHCGGNVVWYISAAIGILCFIACSYYKKFN